MSVGVRHLLWSTLGHKLASPLTSFWSNIYNVVRTFYKIQVVLYHYNGIASVYELLEKGLKKLQDALAGHPDYREFALARDHGARRSNAESARRPA